MIHDTKSLSSEEVMRMIELTRNPYRPKEILKLKNEIESETRVAELRASIAKTIDCELVNKIVVMKIELDGLYVDWVKGKIS